MFALAVPVLFGGAGPAYAATVFVETNPSTARAGDEIGVRASCTDNLQPATVTADPLGTVTVGPSFGFLTATSTLHVVAKVEPSQGPATGGGGTAPGRSAPMLIGGGLGAIAAGLVLAVVSVRRRRVV